MTKPVKIGFSEELKACLDKARDGKPRGPWLESLLWKVPEIRATAEELGITPPDRPADGRGRWSRE